MRTIACPVCGNKRCPHAEWHGYACTGSNELGQIGQPAVPDPRDARIAELEAEVEQYKALTRIALDAVQVQRNIGAARAMILEADLTEARRLQALWDDVDATCNRRVEEHVATIAALRALLVEAAEIVDWSVTYPSTALRSDIARDLLRRLREALAIWLAQRDEATVIARQAREKEE